MSYKPYGKTKKILDKAMEHIKSVEYQVSVRWFFYRLLQDSYYSKKSDYTKFILLTSRARKAWYDKWTPSILSDDTRSMSIYKFDGLTHEPDIDALISEQTQDAIETIEYFEDQLRDYCHFFNYEVDPNCYQPYICVILFEARAMLQQFKTYADDLTLCPCGGQPSIPHKWKIAKYLEELSLRYGKPIKVLYFGDLDDAGEKIFNCTMKDILKWCDSEVEFLRCGLTESQAANYQIPENFEHPGAFQWEALTDAQAKEIIVESLKLYHNFDAKMEATKRAEHISLFVNNAVNEVIANRV